MKLQLMLALPFVVVHCAGLSAQAPQAEIKSGPMSAKLYLPDAKQGFYHSTRFDWSGVVSDLRVGKHHFYKAWFNSIDPTVADFSYEGDTIIASATTAMTGPVEEFQKPIGYDEAQPGETFLKVGVGLLRKGDADPYKFGKKFELVDSGVWTSKVTGDSITFQQVLGKAQSKYGYVYTKTVRLVGSEGKMVIEHQLKNTGQTAIETPIYDHNFLTVDGVGVGKSYSVTVPYDIKPQRPVDPKFAAIEGKQATYTTDLVGKDRISFGLQGFSTSPQDYDFRIRNTAAGVEVRMQGDRPLTNASVWSIRDVLAVEPFIQVSAQPGREFTWTYTYTYSNL